jgi:uncharacterized protein (TIGR02466 family)
MKIDSWFPTLICRDRLFEFVEHNHYFECKALELKKNYKSTSTTNWRCDTFNTLDQYDPSSHRDDLIDRLMHVCRLKVLDFSKEYGVQKDISSLQCIDFWFNIAEHGNYQEFHQHANSHFSLVYYVKVPENSGDIHFKSAESITDMFVLPIETHNLNNASYKSCVYKPAESTILIFRSNLLHMVSKNMSNSDRISIAMNFRFN